MSLLHGISLNKGVFVLSIILLFLYPYFFFEHNIVPDIMIINGIPMPSTIGNASAIALNILLLFLCLYGVAPSLAIFR